jgi:hypothetical protein
MAIPDSSYTTANKHASHVVTYIARIAVAIIILIFLFHKIGVHPVLAGFQSARTGFVIVAVAFVMIMQVFVAKRLKILIGEQGIQLSTLELIKINLASAFYGMFLPGGNVTGIAVRFYKISKSTPNYTATMVSLLCDRFIAALTLCIIGLTLCMFDRSAKVGPSLPILLLSAGAMATIGILLFSPIAVGLWKKTRKAIRLKQVTSALQKTMDSFEVFRNMSLRNLLGLLGLSLGGHLMGIVSFSLLASSLGLNIPFATIGWIRSVAILVTMIPISISGVGIREVAFMTLLSPYGVTGDQAISYSILVFGINVLMVGLAGGLIDARRWLFRHGEKVETNSKT